MLIKSKKINHSPQLFLLILTLCILCTPIFSKKYKKAKKTEINCSEIHKYPKPFDSLPELPFLGSQRFCQIVLSSCDVIFEKSRYEAISLYAYQTCENIKFDFTLKNSFAEDVFLAIVPSIDFKGDYVIKFISRREYDATRDEKIQNIIDRDEISHTEIFEKIKETRQFLYV